MYSAKEYRELFESFATVHLKDNHAPSDLFFISRYTPRSRPNRMHRHLFFQINYVARGGGLHRLTHGEYPVAKGDIFVTPPFIPHLISSDDPDCEIVELEFAPEFINPCFADMDFSPEQGDYGYIEPFLQSEADTLPRLPLTGAQQFEVERILSAVGEEFVRMESGYLLMVRARILELLILVGREYARLEAMGDLGDKLSAHSETIWRAVGYINDHCGQRLTAEQLAERHHLSPSYFRYLFKAITSFTFVEYLTSARINKAISLLKTTDRKVSQISLEAGFSDISHFYRSFRQTTGLTPNQFRSRRNLSTIGVK